MDVAAPLADGPATMAVRPEFLALSHTEATGAPAAHRVIDYGTHLMVDVVLTSGERLKAMAAPNEGWKAGDRLTLTPRDIAIYRDGLVAYRSTESNALPVLHPASPHV
jgi:putative spermidine/putrescine transport system ATP-binding protein